MKNIFKLSLVASTLLSASVFSAEQSNSNWHVSAELGALMTTGNTESTSVFTKITANHQLADWKNKYTFNTLFKEDDVIDAQGNKTTQKTADQYTITGQGDYKLSDTSAAFIFGSYNNDEFGAYQTYTTIAAGYSFRAIEKETVFLDINIGPGYSEGKTQDGVTDDGLVVRASAALEWTISASAKFTQNVSVESAEFNTRTITESALTSSINDSMQMKFGFKTTTNSDVAPGLDKTDTETSATIIVNF